MSGQGKSKACFAALAERKTRFYIAVKIPGRKAEAMENAIVAALSAFPSQLVKTITRDRGAEFANWRRMEERLHCEVYFTDPYCAWQKGAIENLNGLLREFYPRGRNLSRVAPATLKRDLALLNARPRKVLNFHYAQDLWEFELASCCTWLDNSLITRQGTDGKKCVLCACRNTALPGRRGRGSKSFGRAAPVFRHMGGASAPGPVSKPAPHPGA